MQSTNSQIQSFKNPQEYNQYLVNSNTEIPMIDYVDKLNDMFYNIDISFMVDFMDLVGKDECCIHYKMLIKYGILSKSSDAWNVKRIIEQYKLKSESDFGHNVVADSSGDSSLPFHDHDYYLHPRAFKLILMRSKNTLKYSQYYIFLEECVKYFNNMQIMQMKKKIEENNKIKLLRLEQHETLDTFMIVKLPIDSQINDVKDAIREGFPYATIKGSTIHINKTMNHLGFDDDDIILDLYVPSQSNFNKKIKEKLNLHYNRYIKPTLSQRNDKPTKTATRYFKIVGVTENEFIDKVKQIDFSRFIE